MAAVPNPSDLTRHQLDELDALLQRMLALPLNGATTPTAEAMPVVASTPIAAAPKWRIDTPHPAPSSPATLQAPQVVLEPVSVTPASMPVSYSIPARPPRVEAAPAVVERPSTLPLFGPPPRTQANDEPRTLRGVDAPPVAPKPMPAPAVVPPAPLPPPIDLQYAKPDSTLFGPHPAGVVEAPIPLLAWPIYSCNAAMESFLSLFGPLGTGVTAPPVKNLLALCGMLLLAAAGMWCARGMGYVSW